MRTPLVLLALSSFQPESTPLVADGVSLTYRLISNRGVLISTETSTVATRSTLGGDKEEIVDLRSGAVLRVDHKARQYYWTSRPEIEAAISRIGPLGSGAPKRGSAAPSLSVRRSGRVVVNGFPCVEEVVSSGPFVLKVCWSPTLKRVPGQEPGFGLIRGGMFAPAAAAAMSEQAEGALIVRETLEMETSGGMPPVSRELLRIGYPKVKLKVSPPPGYREDSSPKLLQPVEGRQRVIKMKPLIKPLGRSPEISQQDAMPSRLGLWVLAATTLAIAFLIPWLLWWRRSQ